MKKSISLKPETMEKARRDMAALEARDREAWKLSRYIRWAVANVNVGRSNGRRA